MTLPGFILGPREGPAYDFHGARIVIKASGDDTLGQLGVMELDRQIAAHGKFASGCGLMP